jgi:hypothetical protein
MALSKDDRSLAEKLDAAIENLSSWYRVTLIMVIIGLLSLSVVISLSQFTFQEEIHKHGEIKETKDEKSGQVGLAFVPNTDQIFSAESILKLYTTQVWLMASNGVVIGLLSFLFLWITARGQSYKKELKSIESQLIRQSYLVNFETSLPEGDTKTDKILNHSSMVFPELQAILRKAKPGEKKLPYKQNQTLGGETMDVVVSTRKGYFAVKFFDSVSKQALEQFATNLSKSGKPFFRVLCVAKNFDDELQSASLATILQNLDLQFDMDLIFEDDQGYSMLWIN